MFSACFVLVPSIPKSRPLRSGASVQPVPTTQEIDGSRLLDHCMIVFGGGISDGNRHRHSDLPVLLAGGSSRGITTGRHVDFQGVPMTNLYLGILDRAGVQASQVGDSTGVIKDL